MDAVSQLSSRLLIVFGDLGWKRVGGWGPLKTGRVTEKAGGYMVGDGKGQCLEMLTSEAPSSAHLWRCVWRWRFGAHY